MDETRLENRLQSIEEHVSAAHVKLDNLDTRLSGLETNVVTKQEFADLRHSMLHYAKHVESMMESFCEEQRLAGRPL
jgi:phage shock protein A